MKILTGGSAVKILKHGDSIGCGVRYESFFCFAFRQARNMLCCYDSEENEREVFLCTDYITNIILL